MERLTQFFQEAPREFPVTSGSEAARGTRAGKESSAEWENESSLT
ncbi:hypothetical protein [Pontibacter actiniarum]|nr:hypothetical protein [Pontibacter actiniarum]